MNGQDSQLSAFKSNEADQFIVKNFAQIQQEYDKIDIFVFWTEVILSEKLEGEEEIEK